MAVAVFYGITFISIGLVLNIINSIIVGDIERGFLENHGLAGAFFYWGAIAILVKYIVDGSLGIPMWGAILIVGIPLFVIFMREPIYHLIKRKRPLINEPGSYFLGSIVELLDTFTGYLSNTVSFIRVAAFSLAHIALMSAIFALMSTIQSGTVSFIVQVGGNVLVIALEGLVVSIQSVRLIYYEFFSKFYSGEGEAFSPMRIGVLTSRSTAVE
jgi:V/A-type H+-transporting ATPase subunit I